MKSEKEIKKALEAHEFFADKGENQYFENYKNLLIWVLEGEPRYSVAELEKIVNNFGSGFEIKQNTFAFLDFLKDSKRVQEALK